MPPGNFSHKLKPLDLIQCTHQNNVLAVPHQVLCNFFLDFDSCSDIFRDQNSLDNPENLDLEVLERLVEKLRGQSLILKFQKRFCIIMVHIPKYEPHSYSVYLAMVI